MKRIPGISVLVLSAFLTAACDDKDDLTGVDESCENLTGSYVATSFTATGTSNTALNRNLLANGGVFTTSFTGGSFSTSYTAATGTAPLARTGTFTRSGNNITLGTQALWAGGATGNQTFVCSLDDNTLTLTAPNTTFDFAGTGSPQPARIDVTLTRSFSTAAGNP